jgi:hypothetical protein
MNMTTDNEKLFHELIIASQTLVTTSRNAAAVLSEEFESMISGPATAVQAILDQCPQPEAAWDGVFREEDVTEETFSPDIPEEIRGEHSGVGVRLMHKQTGMGTESYQSANRDDNRRRAMKALKSRVELRWREMSQTPS